MSKSTVIKGLFLSPGKLQNNVKFSSYIIIQSYYCNYIKHFEKLTSFQSFHCDLAKVNARFNLDLDGRLWHFLSSKVDLYCVGAGGLGFVLNGESAIFIVDGVAGYVFAAVINKGNGNITFGEKIQFKSQEFYSRNNTKKGLVIFKLEFYKKKVGGMRC